MKRTGMLLVAALMLTACGGGNKVSRYSGGPSVKFASGPVAQACLRSDRKAANRRLCGCIQGVANERLSAGDQRMAASFFSNPHRAQEIRQSDNRGHDAFWDRYKAFASRSESVCRGL